jgi:protein-tyrosine-phosphatase
MEGGSRGPVSEALEITEVRPKPAEEQDYQIYDGKMVLDLIKYSQVTEFLLTAQNFAVDLVRKRGLELGKQEWLDDPWGRSDKQARRDRRFESRR